MEEEIVRFTEKSILSIPYTSLQKWSWSEAEFVWLTDGEEKKQNRNNNPMKYSF